MISISQKCQYALRSLYELARRADDKPTSIGEIAAAQAIPPRFLELILNDLRQGKLGCGVSALRAILRIAP